jgi:hypothetical protein
VNPSPALKSFNGSPFFAVPVVKSLFIPGRVFHNGLVMLVFKILLLKLVLAVGLGWIILALL